MVRLEELGNDLDPSYVVVRIDRDVKFMDEIVEKAQKLSEFKIKAWGNTINLAVRLALEASDDVLDGYSIEHVDIGTRDDVEMRTGKVRPLSWMEISLKRS